MSPHSLKFETSDAESDEHLTDHYQNTRGLTLDLDFSVSSVRIAQ